MTEIVQFYDPTPISTKMPEEAKYSNNGMNGRIRRMRRNAKLSVLPQPVLAQLLNLRKEGYTLREIRDWIIETQSKYYEGVGKPTQHQLHQFYKRYGDKIMLRDKSMEMQKIDEAITSAKTIDKLLEMMKGWLDDYQRSGDKLSLKETINCVIKIHELNTRNVETLKEGDKNKDLNDYLKNITKEFSSPSLTKEAVAEYDKDGLLVKKTVTVTEKTDKKDEKLGEEVIEGESEN